MSDRTDIPHAISAFIEGCDCIVTYDSHFDIVILRHDVERGWRMAHIRRLFDDPAGEGDLN